MGGDGGGGVAEGPEGGVMINNTAVKRAMPHFKQISAWILNKSKFLSGYLFLSTPNQISHHYTAYFRRSTCLFLSIIEFLSDAMLYSHYFYLTNNFVRAL